MDYQPVASEGVLSFDKRLYEADDQLASALMRLASSGFAGIKTASRQKAFTFLSEIIDALSNHFEAEETELRQRQAKDIMEHCADHGKVFTTIGEILYAMEVHGDVTRHELETLIQIYTDHLLKFHWIDHQLRQPQ